MRTAEEDRERIVSQWLQQAADEDELDSRRRSLPTAGHLWWKAQIIRRLVERDRLAERVTRPARWSQWLGLGIGCLLLTSFTAWLGYDLLSGFAPLMSSASAPSALVGLVIAGTALPLLAFGACWWMWRDV